MADTYKRVNEIANKYSTNDQDIDEMIQKYVSKKGLFNKRNPSTQLNRHKQLQSLQIDVNSKFDKKSKNATQRGSAIATVKHVRQPDGTTISVVNHLEANARQTGGDSNFNDYVHEQKRSQSVEPMRESAHEQPKGNAMDAKQIQEVKEELDRIYE